jgi:hypothetical protein
MTPTSKKPLAKVLYGAVAAAVAAIVLALVKHYVWTDLPADLEGPVNTLILAMVVAAASGVTGWLTKIRPGELAPPGLSTAPLTGPKR